VKPRPASIVVPILLLVMTAALIATTTQFTMMFNGPPPGMGPVPIARLAEALRTGQPPAGLEDAITVTRTRSDQFGRSEEQPDPDRDAAIARRLGVAPDRVHGLYMGPPRDARMPRKPDPMMQRMRDPEGDLRGTFTVALAQGDGWVVASTVQAPTFTQWHVRRLLWMVVTLVLLALLAWFAAWRMSRPIRDLAQAAKRARLGSRQPIPRAGPREIRELAGALDTMQTRILEQAENRSAMLAAIAHDLGTPLSRLAFWIEQLPDSARERASADIEEMRGMVQSALRFTREQRVVTQDERTDLGSLVESLVDDLATAGRPVSVEPGPRVVVRGDSAALRRLFANLVENAVRYGERARLEWRRDEEWAEVIVDDDGPGFDPATAEALFAPFARGEASRNRETGGTGLGLAIVRAIAEAHGGTVHLERRGAAGGRVRVRLPVNN
jgi:two-component system, OmpR family, sensor kinase